jgi:hypothetical protein
MGNFQINYHVHVKNIRLSLQVSTVAQSLTALCSLSPLHSAT